MKILLTGFEPFGGESVNPALEAVMRLPETIEDVQILKLRVPTVFGESARALGEALARERPEAVLCVGQAGGREAMTPERVAINCDDARIPDNAGNQPVDQPVVSGGPAAYFATVPIKEIAAAIRAAGIPARVSDSAGTFVCNHLMYALLHLQATEYPGSVGGFIHVPFLPEQAAARGRGEPSMELSDMVRGLEAAVLTVARSRKTAE